VGDLFHRYEPFLARVLLEGDKDPEVLYFPDPAYDKLAIDGNS